MKTSYSVIPACRKRGSSVVKSLDSRLRGNDVFFSCLLGLLFLVGGLTAPIFAARSEIRNGQFYVDGEPFYVAGIGYNSLRPHQKPGVSYAETNKRWIEMDFKRIQAAHFNTLRTWDALTPLELTLAKKYNLMVLQGIWLDPKQDFSDLHNQDSAVAQVESIVQQTKDFDNVLGYVVMTEPDPEAVLSSGQEETLRFFRRLKRTIQAVDPRPVSMDSWLPLGFLDHSIWDFATFNTFAFAPASITHALGYPGYNRWLVDHYAADRPFIVGETGGYGVSKSSWSKYGGYGGLNEYDQSLRDLESLRGTLEGHAVGAVLVSWLDAWHYPIISDKHEDEPWAWNGVLGIPTDSKKDMDGIPRRVYHDVTAYNLLIPLEPKANHLYPVTQRIPIHIYTPDIVGGVEYNINGEEWKPLNGSGHGSWQGFFQLPGTAKRRLRFAVRSLDKLGQEIARKDFSIVAGGSPEHVTIGNLEAAKKTNLLSCRIKVTDGNGHPIAQRKVTYGFFFPTGWRETQGTLTTDANGEVLLSCPLAPTSKDRFLFVAAGTEHPDKIRSGDMRLFKLGPSKQ